MGVRLPPEYQEVDWIGSNNDAYLVIKNAVGLPETTNLKVKTTVLWKNVLSRQIHGRNGRCYFGVAGGYYQNTQTGTGHTQIEAVANEWASVEWSRNDSVCTLKVGNDIDITNSTITTTGSMPFALFALGDGSIRCYCALKETQVEIGSEQFDLIPCYRKQDSKPGMYDLASDTFFVNQGSREFDIGPDVIDSISPLMVAWRQAMMSQKQPRLPIEYQEVPFIIGQGKQYIDTGYVLNSECRVQGRYSVYRDKTELGKVMALFGARDSDYNNAFAMFNVTSAPRIDYGKTLITHSFSYVLINNRSVVDFDLNAGIATVNGSTYAFADSLKPFTCPSTAMIFAAHTGDTIDTRCPKGEIVYLKITDENGTVVRDMIPCYRKSDNKPGMFDLVNKQFYTSAGADDFLLPS